MFINYPWLESEVLAILQKSEIKFLLHGSLQIWKMPTPKPRFTAAELEKVARNEVPIE